ncbi:CbiX/SirB N-terminal domain-containing protein [Ramlibacter tataouinensis]|uniref:sirohydrochlorin chelatase n=1 Tax=Ramlibacter tataouinensis TaxID=94132 RepID=UPI0022F3943E|nr:CbiX/SirB N-terminal domain-containing protein [Ramlibacter tataouinensis]WBY02105.1 CbiX/SirB N-terminal domain-containing protein [Ramlibacter tataouinensis]
MTRGIVLLGHGSRDPAWREPMDAVAARIRARAPDALVACAFLEWQAPDLAAAIDQVAQQGATSVAVLPVFVGVGRHVREDLPEHLAAARRRHPALTITALASVGEQAAALDCMASIALGA